MAEPNIDRLRRTADTSWEIDLVDTVGDMQQQIEALQRWAEELAPPYLRDYERLQREIDDAEPAARRIEADPPAKPRDE